jgi:AcrR family transcriptional regulator
VTASRGAGRGGPGSRTGRGRIDADTAGADGAGPDRADGRIVRGERTRAAVLRRAADIASVEGLDGLSLGRLAADLAVSKAGVFAHFGSKEELQLATIRAASDRFTETVITPALDEPDGLARLVALCNSWLDYCHRREFPGGCFFFSAFADYDAKPGRVHDALADARRLWLGVFEALVSAAQQQGELDPDIDPAMLAFEFDAMGMAINIHMQLLDDPGVVELVRRSMFDRLRRAAVGDQPLLA